MSLKAPVLATLFMGFSALAIAQSPNRLIREFVGSDGRVRVAGDVDGDGATDLVQINSDTIVRVLSGATGALLRSWTIADGFRIDAFGVGDVNHDGRADILIAEPYYSPPTSGLEDAGRITVYSGATGSMLWQLLGQVYNQDLGLSVALVGDINGDGVPDLRESGRVISGASGAVLAILNTSDFIGMGDIDHDGRVDLAAHTVENPNHTGFVHRFTVYSGATNGVLLTFDAPLDVTSWPYYVSMAGAGDVNADGNPDLIIGFFNSDTALVFSGTDGTVLLRLTRGEPGDGLGSSVSGAGDIDGDGHDDVLVGAPRAGGQYVGAVTAFSGRTGATLFEVASEFQDQLGAFVEGGIGDLNGDRIPDFLAGGWIGDNLVQFYSSAPLPPAPPLPASAPSIDTIAGTGDWGSTGDDGPATLATLVPWALAVDATGNIYVSDYGGDSERVRRIDAVTGYITAFAGGGTQPYPNDSIPATDAALGEIYGVALDSAGNVCIAEGQRVRRVDRLTGTLSTIAGGVAPTVFMESYPLPSGDGGPATSAYLGEVYGIVFDDAGNLYIATNPPMVRRVDGATGTITTVAGNGVYHVLGYGFGPEGTYSGDGGPAIDAGLLLPMGMAIDPEHNLYIIDNWNQRIRRVDRMTGTISTAAGTGLRGHFGNGGPAVAAEISGARYITSDAGGNLFFMGDDQLFRRIDRATGILTTVAGRANRESFGGDGGPAELALLSAPAGLARLPDGSMLLADAGNCRIRQISGLSVNAPPTADAGPDQSIHASGIVQLDGTNSFDDNTASIDLTYHWTLVSTPAGSTASLNDPCLPDPTFVVDLPGTYVAELVVEDSAHLASTPDMVFVSSTDLAPTANAGSDCAGVVNQIVLLDGTASSDPENDPLTFFWSFTQLPSGSAAALAGSLSPAPGFLPDVAGTYVVGLIVDDGFGPSLVDEVVITVITGLQFAANTTATAINTSAALPSSSVTTAGNQQALLQFLSQAVQGVQGGNLSQARSKLQMAISRCDGWTLRGSADQNGPGRDWVTEEIAARDLYGQLNAALNALNP